MAWTKGRGLLGPMKPLMGRWITANASGSSAAAGMHCRRTFSPFGKSWVELDARWQIGPDKEYRERAFFGAGEDGSLAFYSFTNDGKRSVGRLAEAADVPDRTIAFEAQMRAGLARMLYWPLDDDRPGFWFAVESKTAKGWNRFLKQQFVPMG